MTITPVNSAYNSFSQFDPKPIQATQTRSRIPTPTHEIKDVVKISSKNVDTNPKNLVLGSLIALGIGALAVISNKKAVPVKNDTVTETVKTIASPYLEKLSKGLSDYTGKKITADRLKSVMTREEFVTAIKNLKDKNYIPSKENIEKGIFRADLHSHSNYSDGKGTVETILDDVAKYADSMHAKTKEKFIFALTDHDEINGVKKSLEIIANNPEKFKNVRFVTGIEASYTHPSINNDISWGTSEVLIHCIDPFSENANKFCDDIKVQRKNMINGFMQDAKEINPDVNFSMEEAIRTNFIRTPNLHGNQWSVFHYIETKRGVAKYAKEQGKNAEQLYEEIMKKLDPSQGRYLSTLQDKGLIRKGFAEDKNIKSMCNNKYSPKFENGKMISQGAEHTLENIMDAFSKEKEVFISFAHPVFIIEHARDKKGQPDINVLRGFLDGIVEKSKGLIQGTEAYHQSYFSKYKTMAKEINSFLETKNLINLGGRDNHEPHFL